MAKKVTIGQTTALIPEAGSAIKDEWIIDGESGNTNFPYADFKALATVGEVGPKSRLALTGYLLATAGGKLNPRQIAGAAALPGSSWLPEDGNGGQGAEFSGSWDITGLVAKNDDGSFYSKEELSGTGLDSIQNAIPIEDHLYQGVVQYRGESGG